MTIVLLGASGYTGRLVAAALDARGIAFEAAGRDRGRLERATADLAHCSGLQVADVTDAGDLRRVAEADVLVTTVGPFSELGRPVLEAAIAGGCHYVDSTGEQSFLRWAFQEHRGPAADAGVAAVPAAGFDYVPGDLLAAVAASGVEDVREVHVAYLVRGGMALASRGTRSTVASMAGRTGCAYVDGRLVAEPPAQARRIGWFPRPVGPRNTVGFPGGEAVMVPYHLPEVQVVRTYLAVPGVLSDAAQLVWSATRWEPVRRLLRGVLTLGPEGPGPEQRRTTRWACVAEVVAAGGETIRAWASGRDPYGFTAEAMAIYAERLDRGAVEARGVLAPAEAVDAVTLLDELADRSALRWSVRRPDEDGA